MVASQTIFFDQFHKKNHYLIPCTKWTSKGVVQGLILKDALFECGDHLQNTHHPLTLKP
jgi:hypothetical protein